MNDATKHSGPVDVRAVIRAVIEELRADGNTGHVQSLLDADAAVAELIEDANRWRAVTAVYAGFQTRGDQMSAHISTPQWVGDWSDFNNAIDRHFEINGAALANVGSAS